MIRTVFLQIHKGHSMNKGNFFFLTEVNFSEFFFSRNAKSTSGIGLLQKGLF